MALETSGNLMAEGGLGAACSHASAGHSGRGSPGAGFATTLGPESAVAIEPLVAGLATDAVAATELSERRGGSLGIEHETLALVQG